MRRIDWNNTVQIDPEFRTEYGVVFACPFKERGGVTVRDYSGNRYDGTLVNGPTRAFDKWGGPALTLDASDDYIDAATSISAGSGYMSIWLRPDNVTSGRYVLDCGNSALDSRTIICGFQSGCWNVFKNGYPTGTASQTQMAASGVGIWDHVLYQSNGSTLQGYLNGVKLVDVSASLNLGATLAAVSVGRPIGTSSNYYGGDCAHVVLGGSVLTDPQVARMYRDPYAMYWQPSRHSFFVPGSSPPTSYATYLTLLGVG